jgi:putative NADH-flavin reductase
MTPARSSALRIASLKVSSRLVAPRLIVVDGAGSLFVAPGVTVRESGHVPKEWIPIVDAHIQVFRNLKQSSIDWTYFSPAGFFEPGERTGKFRLGKDDLITDAQGNSRVLGESLTPFPKPAAQAQLVRRGIYAKCDTPSTRA